MYRWNAFIHCSSDKLDPLTFAVDTRKVGASLSPPTEREYSCWADVLKQEGQIDKLAAQIWARSLSGIRASNGSEEESQDATNSRVSSGNDPKMLWLMSTLLPYTSNRVDSNRVDNPPWNPLNTAMSAIWSLSDQCFLPKRCVVS